MSRIAIHVEGGNRGKGSRGLRRGIDGLLSDMKAAAQRKGMGWRVQPGRGRANTFKHFLRAIRSGDAESIHLLLVDAESSVRVADPRLHLKDHDGWDLSDVPVHQVHLMVQTMETWIVADPEAVADYYGQGTRTRKLPARRNLEEEPKHRVLTALAAATKPTRKGRYNKTRHGPVLLRRIDANAVRDRCPHCDRLFRELGRIVSLQ